MVLEFGTKKRRARDASASFFAQNKQEPSESSMRRMDTLEDAISFAIREIHSELP